jgi:hypothetical protein
VIILKYFIEAQILYMGGEIVREINVSRTGDPVHAGDKALTRETPVQRGRVDRYAV